jgi:hypothetical protein
MSYGSNHNYQLLQLASSANYGSVVFKITNSSSSSS